MCMYVCEWNRWLRAGDQNEQIADEDYEQIADEDYEQSRRVIEKSMIRYNNIFGDTSL